MMLIRVSHPFVKIYREYSDKIESNKRELMMVKDQESVIKARPQARVFGTAAGSSAPPSTGKMNTMVGFDDCLVHVMDQLTKDESDLQIVSITGMGGIGKTTLAQSVFDSRCIVDRFDLCKWITISQSYSIQEVLIKLVGGSDNQILTELGVELHKMLFGRRYFIVMDDVWSIEVWEELRRFFPNNKNGSRVLVTTRLSKVAICFGSHKPYSMPFLDNKTSWKLFCIKVFGYEICPNPELEEIRKDIVECCKGLPLAISTIGGLLRKSNMTRDDWEPVAKDVLRSIDNSKDDEDCSNILSLSYKHLPIHLKPCFLYMRIFREDEEFFADDLINYWVAEGFVKSKDGQTLEEITLEYLKDLIDRNLILMHRLEKHTGDILRCKVNDLLRDLCMREYEKELFFIISKVGKTGGIFNFKDGTCFLCRYRKASTWVVPQVCSTVRTRVVPQVCSTVRTLVSGFVCDVCNVLASNRNRLRLVGVGVDSYSQEYLTPTRLRYLRISSPAHKFESAMLPILWSLHFLFLLVQNVEPPIAIWEMPQLRYLDVILAPRSTQIGWKDHFILEKLQVLVLRSINGWCVEEILKRIPNVKTLYLDYDCYSKEFHNFAYLHKLQELMCIVNLEYMSFPNSLKELELRYCECPWEGMTVIGSLPNLEVLILRRTHGGLEWNPIEGKFLRLKTLSIEGTTLVGWNAEKYHFPRLELLELRLMKFLEEIPSAIGDIDTLRLIRVLYCTESTVQSAKKIIAEQRDYGNEELQLIINHYTYR